MRLSIRVIAVWFALVSLAAIGTACRPATPSASTAGSCDNGGPVDQAITAAFGDVDLGHAYVIVHRESGCDPCAFYSRQHVCGGNPRTAKGLFQLLGHDDMIFAACPNPYGVIAWDVPSCNANAARSLYNGSGGWSPWGG